VEPEHPEIPIARQCELLDLSRSSYYYRPVAVSAEELTLLRRLDEQYTQTPFYGVRKMTAVLRHEGYAVNPKRVRRLLRTLGLWALVPQPGTSRPAPEHRVYPYLLRGVAIERVNQVWSTDITYIRLRSGFAYLVAVLDWYSRYVLAWALSNSLEVGFCLEVLEAALSPFAGPAGDLQQRPGSAVHEPGVHGAAVGGGSADQHGWARPSAGQRVRGAAVAECEIRGSVSARL
jgi:putative transposase